ncbi:hypothetical protein V8D89_002913, partial [Ganoderma adspersum]
MLFSQKSPLPFFAAPCRDIGVDALQLLTKQIVAEVHNLVTPPLARERTHSDLLQSLYAAFGQGLAIVGGLMNTASPINRIPPELLVTIFALSPERYSPMSRLAYWPFMEPRMSDLHKLPKICRYWRELALGTPTLWNHVVTFSGSQGHDAWFGRSIYLPDDASVDLNVHFNTRTNSKPTIEKMTEFMLTNAPRIRELHAWDASTIDLPLFLKSFDANALEHCTISQKMAVDVPIGTPYHSGRPLFFSSGGARLRSLCLNDLQFLPANVFPALTLLKIDFVKRRSMNWVIEDLVKFLTGSPKLEEVYVHHMPYAERKIWDKSPAFTLRRLRYLAFTYTVDITYEAPTHPIDLLLSRISIPFTCHMYFPVPSSSERTVTKSVIDILATVCRHIPGKSAVSHCLLQLTGRFTTMQFMFHHGGSLQLRILGSSSHPFSYGDLQRAVPDLFVTMEELRFHYDSDDALEAALSLPTSFPNIRAISIICPVSSVLWSNAPPPSLRAGLALLVPPRPQLSSESTSPEDSAEGAREPPFPALDTLWVAVNASDEIEQLEATLAARTALGLPIHRIVVTLRYSPSPPAGDSNLDDIARLRALRALVEEVIVMDREHSGALEEVDWLVRLPERYDLPSSIHRDWPMVWG